MMSKNGMYRAFQIQHKIDEQIRMLEQAQRHLMKLEREALERNIIKTYLLPIAGRSSVLNDFRNRF